MCILNLNSIIGDGFTSLNSLEVNDISEFLEKKIE